MLFLKVTPRNYTRIYLQPLLKMQIEIPMRGLGIFIQAFLPASDTRWELETLQNSSSRSTETQDPVCPQPLAQYLAQSWLNRVRLKCITEPLS